MEYSNIVLYNKYANIEIETIFIPNSYYDYEVGIYLNDTVYKGYIYKTNNLKDATEMHNYYVELVKTNSL